MKTQDIAFSPDDAYVGETRRMGPGYMTSSRMPISGSAGCCIHAVCSVPASAILIQCLGFKY